MLGGDEHLDQFLVDLWGAVQIFLWRSASVACRHKFRNYAAGPYGASILIILGSLYIEDTNLSIHSRYNLKG